MPVPSDSTLCTLETLIRGLGISKVIGWGHAHTQNTNYNELSENGHLFS